MVFNATFNNISVIHGDQFYGDHKHNSLSNSSLSLIEEFKDSKGVSSIRK
jgi:hypothetical protein